MADLTVKGKKYTEEELAAAVMQMEKFKERKAKAKERRKTMSPEEKAKRTLKSKARRFRTKLILELAFKAGINPSDKDVLDYMKKAEAAK